MVQKKRLADVFLADRGKTLGEKGFETDTQLVEILHNDSIVF